MVNHKTMMLRQAKDESEWKRAHEILSSAAHRLAMAGKPLWTEAQVSLEGLKASYKLDELYFLIEQNRTVGLVFLQSSDPKFWPEITDGKSLFFHKLAIHPEFSGLKKGDKAIKSIVEHAKNKGFTWVRLDCNEREALLKFYQTNGFSYVGTEQIDGFKTARHQLFINGL